jgi:hypothetical protein
VKEQEESDVASNEAVISDPLLIAEKKRNVCHRNRSE